MHRTFYARILALVFFVWGCLPLPAAAQLNPPNQPAYSPYAAPGYQSSLAAVAFQPSAKTAWVAASTTSANIAITGNQVQVANSSSAYAFVIFGNANTVTASAGSAGTQTTDYPVAPGGVVVMTISQFTTYVAVVLASGTGAVYFTPGVGL